jgi:hypothetical protein
MNPLDEIERRLERLVEGTLTRLLGGEITAGALAAKLAQAMVESSRETAPDLFAAPDQYVLSLHPATYAALQEEASTIAAALAKALQSVADQEGLALTTQPEVTLVQEEGVPPWQVSVLALHRTTPLESTREMRVSTPGETPLPERAYLILEGRFHHPLESPVVNLGRRDENQIVLKDPHVSRNHAQLRVRDGRFVLFDLGSKAGTEVNGIQIKQHILQPGDVISICGHELVYGEDSPAEATGTQGITPHPPEEGTKGEDHRASP